MRTVIYAFGGSDPLSIPLSWGSWTFQDVAYRRWYADSWDDRDVITATANGQTFLWTDDGTRVGWVAIDNPTGPLVARI